MNNRDYFEYSRNNPETMFDSYYVFSDVVIPQTSEEHNVLTESNERLIDLITTFQVLRSLGKQKEDADISFILQRSTQNCPATAGSHRCIKQQSRKLFP